MRPPDHRPAGSAARQPGALPSHAVLLTGQFGSGKTAVAVEVAHQLERRGVRNAAIDLDWLSWVGPGVEGAALQGVLAANLTAVAANYRAVGVDHLVLARALLSPAHRATVEQALPGCALTVIRLVVDDSVASRRVSARDSGAELAELLADERDVSAAVAGAGVQDVDVDNDGTRPVTAVADEVLRACGWAG
jgi:predicted kinase